VWPLGWCARVVDVEGSKGFGVPAVKNTIELCNCILYTLYNLQVHTIFPNPRCFVRCAEVFRVICEFQVKCVQSVLSKGLL